MLRIITNRTADGAKSYYGTSDYYTEAQELRGEWRGKGAALLGLSDEVQREDWAALCDNRDPATGETLTLRQKSNRRIGYDFNFHVPKSVSLLYGLTGDERICEAFRGAVDETMQDIEREAKARVRVNGQNSDAVTGNLVWGEFVHTTARPINGEPDPHLHAHCFVFNATWDGGENRWKAGQFADLKRDGSYFEALFHARLADALADQGLPIARTGKGWELAGLSEGVLRRFSRRTAEIEALAEEKGITDPERKGELGAKTRRKKVKALSPAELRARWRERLGEDDRAALALLAARIGSGRDAADPRAAETALSLAQEHLFERASVVSERTLAREALKRAWGNASAEAVLHQLSEAPLLRGTWKGQRCVTEKSVLEEEQQMLAFARIGRGSCSPIVVEPHQFQRDWLGEDQKQAVEQLLASRDRVAVIRGPAGTGKTSMMQEAVAAIEATGLRVLTLAPSANASRGVLRDEGFATADTVARLLVDEKLQESLRGQVLWIDEAGQLSSRTMAATFALADRIGARVVLSGDRRQHGSVERGAALRLLEEEAGIVPGELREVRRQRGDYKRAVTALSEGRVEAGLRDLDRLGWIREIDGDERYRQLANDYVDTVLTGKSALVVSPTHLEGDLITREVRTRLKEAGRIHGREVAVPVLRDRKLTLGERRDRALLRPDDILEFTQNARGHKKGERILAGSAPPVELAERYRVLERQSLGLAEGDVVRLTNGGTTTDGKHRLNNGTIYAIKGFTASGDLLLSNGWTVARDFGHLAYGYCMTSHASQGKTVDRVFIGQSSLSGRAASQEQFYVSVSRGREQAVIYTDDKEALREAAGRSDERTSATELVREQGRLLARQQAEVLRSSPAPSRQRAKELEHG